MEVLLVVGGVAVLFLFIKIMVPMYKRSILDSRDRVINKRKQKTVVKQVASGQKPFGAPFVGSAYGSAYFLTTQQLIDKGLAGEMIYQPIIDRVYLGAIETKRPDGSHQVGYLYAPKEGHIISVAPTRSGKGACHVIPNLLNYDGSVIVNDIKGENADVTERFRKTIGQKVYRFAPLEENSASWNPLDFIADGGNRGTDAALMADMLIMDNGQEQAFWISEAKSLLSGVIMYVMTEGKPEERTMETVRAHLMLPSASFDKMLDNMAASKETFVKHAAIGFMKATEKVQASIQSTINSNMRIWDFDEVKAVTGTSDFKFEDLKNERISIFFCIPPEELDIYTTVMRLFFGQAVKAMSRNKTAPELPVMFILDEFPQLGRMEQIQKGFSYLAGLGVHLWLFAQNLGQIKSVYGENDTQSIFANCACQVFFGTNDWDTAKEISDMCGTMTIAVESHSKTRPNGLTLNPGTQNENMNLTGRPLMMPDEVMAMPGGNIQLVFMQGENPILGELTPYYKFQKVFPPKDYDEWEGR